MAKNVLIVTEQELHEIINTSELKDNNKFYFGHIEKG